MASERRPGSATLALILITTIHRIVAQDPAADVIDVQAGLKPQINTPASTADLSCESKRMVVNLTFAQPFFGKIFAENNPTDATCIRDFTAQRGRPGGGVRSLSYYMPLKECGTNQLGQGRDFENTFQIRYGPNTDEIQQQDERKTILCRYPPPVVPAPLPIPPPPAAVPPIVPKASVSELELLLIIAAVLFLGLLLLGLCCAWWCFRRRAAAKQVESEGVLIEQPDVMKLSGTTIPFLDNIRIPRATASVSGSDVSEAALINRLEGSGSQENFPIVPHGDNEILRIPHVTQLSKGYELQEATMIIPPGAQSVSEGDVETKASVTETQVEHSTFMVPPVPARPPSPLHGSEYEQETRSDLMETDVEHTLIAGRRPRPAMSPPLDMRSITEITEENMSRNIIPQPPRPVPKLPPKMTMTELETEQNSVTESLENELILRAVPKKQPRLMPPPQRSNYPLDTRTETTIIEEETKRVFPPRPPIQTTTTTTDTEDVVRKVDQRFVPGPVFQPPPQTTKNVKETNIRRFYDVYPERPPVPPPAPPASTTTTTRETDIQREYEFIPPSRPVYQPPQTTTQTTTETDIRREYESIPPRRPPQTTTRTTTETDIRREFESIPPSKPMYPPPQTTTRTTTETDIRREFEAIPPKITYPPPQTTTRTTTETDIRREFESVPPSRPFYQPPQATTRTTTETDIRREFQSVPPSKPVYQPPNVTQRTTTETDIRRDFESSQPTYQPPQSTTRTTTETDIRREFDVHPPTQSPYHPHYTTQTRTETDIVRDYETARPYVPRGPGQTSTTGAREYEDVRIPRRPIDYDHSGTTMETTEQISRHDENIYSEPRFPPAMGPLMSTMDNVERRFSHRQFPLSEDTRTFTQEDRFAEDYASRGTRPVPQDATREPWYTSSTTGDTRQGVFGPLEREERYVSSVSRNIQKETDIGTPPKSSTPDKTLDGIPSGFNGRSRVSDLHRDRETTPSTFIPRPVLREPWSATTRTTTTTTATAVRHDSPPSSVTDFPHAQPTIRPFATPPDSEFNEPRPPVTWTDIRHVFERYPSLWLPEADMNNLHSLMTHDQEFQLNITRVRAVNDLYYIHYLPPYVNYFTTATWITIIRIFIIVLDLPRPHPGDPDFIEPRSHWFARPYPLDRSGSDTESNATSGPSFAERALSEFTEVSHVAPRVVSDASDGDSSYFGSIARRGEFGAAERSVTEFFEGAPTMAYTRTYREQRERRSGIFREADEEKLSEL